MTVNSNTKTTPNHSLTQCPFAPKEGYTTKAVYDEYYLRNFETAPRVDVSNEYGLMGNANDHNEPLFFWQLYSILGTEPILKLITDFYERVFHDDEQPWFRDAFVNLGVPMSHHVHTQAAYWIDAMGGGRVYHGGEYRLHFHHKNNARAVMTAAGASRWMYHMRQALQAAKFDDPRVKPVILDFLDTKMKSYADQFGWEYNPKDMELYQD